MQQQQQCLAGKQGHSESAGMPQGAYGGPAKLAASYYPQSPEPGAPAAPAAPLSYLQQRHQQLVLSKAMAHSTSMLTNDSYLAGMSSDSELSAGSSSSRAHARPHSSQSRVYHAHPAPRPADPGRSPAHYCVGGSGGSPELGYPALPGPTAAPPPSTTPTALGRRQQQPASPHQQQRPSRLGSTSAAGPPRQLPSRPFKHSMSVDQQGYQHHQHQQQQQQQQQPYQPHQPHQLAGGGSAGLYGSACMDQAVSYSTGPPVNHQSELWAAQQHRQQPQMMQESSENRFRHDLDYLEKRANAISLSSGAGPAGALHSSSSPTRAVPHQQQHSALRYPAAGLGLSADQLAQSMHLQQASGAGAGEQPGPVDWLPPMGRSGVPFKQAMSIDQQQAYPALSKRQQPNNYYRPSHRQHEAELAIRLEQQQQKSLYLSQNNHYHHGSHQQLYSTPADTLPGAGYLSQHPSEQPYTVQQQQQQQQQQHRMQDTYGNSSKLAAGHMRERSPAAGVQQQPAQQLRSAVKRGGPQLAFSLGSSTSALNLELGQAPAAAAELSSEPQTAKSLLASATAEAPTKRPQLRAASPGASLSLARPAPDSPSPGTSVAARQADRQQQHYYLAREPGQQALASSESTRSESSTGASASNGPHDTNNSSSLTKKSNSATQLSMSGTKKRLGFRKKQITSFSVHRSEEVGGPPNGARHLVKQGSSVSEGESSLSGDSSSRSWSNSNFKQQTSEEVASMSFIDGLGKGQMISRQGLASPYLGDIQLSLSDRRGNLEVEVIRARNLQAKANKILPLTYVKLYLVKNRKCLAKAKTALCSKRTLDPLFQQQLTFHEDYHGSILQSIVWGNFGKMDKKNFMGIAQISIDDLDLSDTVLSWYKLFLPSSLQTMPSKSLRHTLLSNSTDSFTTNTNTNTNS